MIRSFKENKQFLETELKKLRKNEGANNQIVNQLLRTNIAILPLNMNYHISSRSTSHIFGPDIPTEQDMKEATTIIHELLINLKELKGPINDIFHQSYKEWKAILERGINDKFKFGSYFKEMCYAYLCQECKVMFDTKFDVKYKSLSFQEYLRTNEEIIE